MLIDEDKPHSWAGRYFYVLLLWTFFVFNSERSFLRKFFFPSIHLRIGEMTDRNNQQFGEITRRDIHQHPIVLAADQRRS